MRSFCSSEVVRRLMVLVVVGAGSAAGAQDALDLRKSDSKDLPVIVLTGFEPFGQDRPPNPSWEGIRELNGREFSGFRIVAKQLPVIWGEPQKQISKLIDEHHPVAIFSFGQGAPGAFAIESVAKNARAEIPDNAGMTPPEPSVSADGPNLLKSSFPCTQMKTRLAKSGFPTRVSTSAGQYLCEETLYSLELVRGQKSNDVTVSFCHVPPLGTRVGPKGETSVDAAYVQTFVEAYLNGWIELQKDANDAKTDKLIKKPSDAECVSISDEQPPATQQGPQPGKAKNPEEAAVELLIEEYFKSWSEQRMKDYGTCFADDAVIQELNSRREINTQSKGPFVTTQATYHKMAIFKAVEIPVRTTITFEAELARVVVYWKLTAGPRKQFGYDHFTLVKQDGEWKIANLVFYGTNDKE